MRHIPICLLATALLSACAGTTPYSNDGRRNLQIRTVTESGSAFSSVRASVHIHSVDAACKTRYRGTIDLDNPSVLSGLPVGRQSYLVFAFNSSSFLGGSRSAISYETLLTPRPGYTYDVEVSYVDDMYNAVIREAKSRRKARRGREIDQTDLRSCRRRGAGKRTG